MNKKIFISSTYRDLVNHRREVWKLLNQYNVPISGMEEFGARKSSPLETCLHEVEECDIYVAIIAMRYGSVNKATGKSYTQLEYDKAISENKEILIYLIDESNGIIHTGNIDFEENYYRLKTFKESLKHNHTVDFFKDETELIIKLNKRLQYFFPNEDQIALRPSELSCKIFRIQIDKTTWCIFISYFSGRPFEIFSAPNDEDNGIFLPKNLTEGLLVREQLDDNLARYDFHYLNKRGYKTIIEEINDLFDEDSYRNCKILTELMTNQVRKNVILKTIDNMKNNHNNQWCLEIKSILEKLL